MKLRIEQQALASATQWGHRHLPATPVMPQLAALRLVADNGQVTISGTDLDTTTHATVQADVLEPGTLLASARLLADIAGALPAGPVDLIADGRQLTATVPDTTYTLPLLDDHNYPTLPQPPAAGGHVDGGELAAAIGNSLPAVMPQKDAVGSVAGLGGIHIATDGTHATVSASNRFVIVQHTIAWTPEGPDADGELLVPEPVLKASTRALAGPTRLHFADHNGIAAISTSTTQVVTRCIAERFPDFRPWSRPAEDAASIDFEPADLARAAQRMALVNDKERPVSLTIGDGTIEVSGGHDDRHSTTRIDCTTAGDLDGFRIAFNPSYLATALKPIEGTARMWLTSPTKWAHIRPANPDDTTYWATCMPLRMPK
jgi:DNA polymerase-3 subunit beta